MKATLFFAKAKVCARNWTSRGSFTDPWWNPAVEDQASEATLISNQDVTTGTIQSPGYP